jgi:histone deacetylase 11
MLPPFLDAICGQGNIGLAIYNAGTDIFTEDQLGGMTFTAKGVLERDRFVLEHLIERKMPTLVLLSGGYSRQSYQLVAAMASSVLETWGET